MTNLPVTIAAAREREPDGRFKKGCGALSKGRPRGSKNRLTKAARDAIALAAEGLGGVEGLIAWVREDKKNEFAFWTTIYPKLLPLQLRGDAAHPLRIVHRVERIIVDPVHSESRQTY